MFSKMKKLLTAVLAVAMVITSVNVAPMTVNAATKAVQKVEITKPDSTVLVLKKGKTYKLKAKATPAKASQKFTYKSSKKSVVTVDSKGKLKAKKAGTAKITVTSKAKKSKKDTIKVIVGTPVTKVALNSTAAALKVGETQTLSVTLSPKKPSYKKVKWTTSDEAVASVSSAGVVTAKAAGTAVITVKADDGSGKKASCTVTVEKPADPTPAPTPTPTPTPTPAPTPTEASLSALEIKTAPQKTEYYAGDTVDTTGLSVAAVYSDGSKKDVALENCTLGIMDASGAEDPIDTRVDLATKYIVVSYTEGGVTAAAKQEITVLRGEISKVESSETEIEVANGTSEADVKAELAKLTLTGNEGSVIGNSAEAWTIENYAADTAGDYTAVLSDISKLVIPENRVWRDDPELPSIKVTVKKIPVTSIQASEESITVAGGTTEAVIKEELAKLTLTANEAVALTNKAELWTVADYDVTKPGKTYTATLDAESVIPENYELAEDFEAVTVSVVVEKITITSFTVEPAEIDVAYTLTKDAVLAKVAALTLKGNDSIEIEDTAEAWTSTYAADTEGEYTATLDPSKLTLPEGYVLGEVNVVTVTLHSTVVSITTISASAEDIDVDVNTDESDVKKALAELSLTGNDEVTLTNTEDAWTIDSYDAATAGRYTATLNTAQLTAPEGYKFADGVVDVTVNVNVGKVVKKIEITTQPTKTVYALNSKFDATGMVVTATYPKDVTEDVTKSVTVGEADLSSVGEKKVEISFTENEVTVTAEVTINVVTDAEYVQQAMTAHYTFDETLANSKSESGTAAMEKYHNTGASDGTPSYVEGIDGNAVQLAGGKSDGIKLDAKITSNDYTISMWVKPSALSSTFAPVFYSALPSATENCLVWFSCYGDPHKFLIRSATDGWSNRIETDELTDALVVGKWSMLTLAMKGDQATVYVNGTSAWTGALEKFYETKKDASLYLGSCNHDDTFNGAFDEVSIYGETLSADQVSALYDNMDTWVTGLNVSESEILVGADADEDAMKAALAELTITAELNTSAEAPAITNDTNWILTATEGGYTAEKTVTLPAGYNYAPGMEGKVSVTVRKSAADAKPTAVTVKTAPKIEYYEGESFDAAGMVLTVTYSDGNAKEITEGYTVDLKDALTKDNTEVTVSYKETVQEEDVEVSVKLPISVYEKQVITYSFDDSLDSDASGVSATKYGNNIVTEGNGNAAYAEGISGKALSFDATAGYGLGTIPAGCGSATISFWMKSSMTGSEYRSVTSVTPNKYNSTGKENWYGIAKLNGGTARGNGEETIGRKSFDNISSEHLLDGNWKYVTLVMDGSTAGTETNSIAGTMYVNGEVYGTGDIQNNLITDTTEVFVGITAWSHLDGVYEGLIDEYSYANYAYTQAEAKAAYAAFNDTIHTIKSVSAEKSSLKLTIGTTEEQAKEELAKLALTGTTVAEAKTAVTNAAAAWKIENYNANTAGDYTATLTANGLTAADYTFADDVELPSVTVTLSAALASIAITTEPTKTDYVEDEVFDKTGMVVMATYEGGSTADVTADVQISSEPLTAGATSITVSYTLGEVTKTAEQAITVKSVLDARTASYAFDDSLKNGVGDGMAAMEKYHRGGASDTAAVYVTGISGNAISLAGGVNTDGVKLDAKISSDCYTISMWLKPETQTADYAGAFYAAQDNVSTHYLTWYTRMSGAGFVGMLNAKNNSGRTDTSEVADMFKAGEWQMVTYTVDGAEGKVYVNGELKTTANQAAGFFGYAEDISLYIGTGGIWDNNFKGAVDEVNVYDGYALPASAVQKLYHSVNTADSGEVTE